MTDDLLSTAQAAVQLGVTPSWISKLVKRDQLKPVRKLNGIRGAFLFDPQDIERLKEAS